MEPKKAHDFHSFLKSHDITFIPIEELFTAGVDTFEKLKNFSDDDIESMFEHSSIRNSHKAARDVLNNLSS